MASEQEIKQLTFLIEKLIEKITPKIRFEELAGEIKKIPELNHLFDDDLDVYYKCESFFSSVKFNHLQKCIIMTSEFKILEEYIDLYLADHPEMINYQNDQGWTSLMLAIRNCSESTVEILLKHNPNIHLQNKNGETALSLYFKYFSKHPINKILLLLNKMDNCDINVGNKKLISCIADANLPDEIVNLAIQKGANISDIYTSAFIKSKLIQSIQEMLNKS